MRLIKVSTSNERVAEIIKLAFAVGIQRVSKSKTEIYRSDGEREEKISLDIETSTLKAKRFVDALLAADFYDRNEITFNTRQPRSIVSGENLRDLTVPIIDPAVDILEDLWQFSQLTVSFVGRFFVGGCFLAYGLIHQQLLIMIAGLLFLPFLPLLLAIGFGLRTGQKQLIRRGAITSLAAIGILLSAGMFVALFSVPPVKYSDFNSLLVNFFISLAVGTGAVLANTDDVGRRELIGLAATSQLAINLVWFGVCLILGFPATMSRNDILMIALAFPLNFLTITTVTLIGYTLLGANKPTLKKLAARSEN